MIENNVPAKVHARQALTSKLEAAGCWPSGFVVSHRCGCVLESVLCSNIREPTGSKYHYSTYIDPKEGIQEPLQGLDVYHIVYMDPLGKQVLFEMISCNPATYWELPTENPTIQAHCK